MTDYNDIINNLNKKLFFKLNKIRVVPDKEEREKTVSEYLGGYTGGMGNMYSGGTSNSRGYDPRDTGGQDQPYTTYVPHKITPDHIVKKRKAKNEEEEEKDKHFVDLEGDEDELQEVEAPEAPEAPMPEEPAPEDPGGEPDMGPEPDMGGEPGMEAGMDPSDPGLGDPSAGMPGMEEPKDPSELGRTYEMKKIYSRLISMNQYLADEQSPKIVKTKQNIAKAIDLFAVIGANPESYKEKIDEIIISYYKFLESAYRRVKAFYKAEAKRVGGIPLGKKEEQNND